MFAMREAQKNYSVYREPRLSNNSNKMAPSVEIEEDLEALEKICQLANQIKKSTISRKIG